jgi:hypothetical protein
MFKFPSLAAYKAGAKRGLKAVAALAVAGLLTQIKPVCDLLPAQVSALVAAVGFTCAGLLGAGLLALEKTLNFKD